MKKMGIIALLLLCFACIAGNSQTTKSPSNCSANCCKEKIAGDLVSKTSPGKAMETAEQNKAIACKLTNPDLQKRKEEVLTLLKEKVIDRQELSNGYKYKFDGTGEIIEQLVAFIKSERACCDFFTFDLSISDIKSYTWLSITGPTGTKGFIKTEMGL